MDELIAACNTTFVSTSGTGVIGLTGKPMYLQAIYVGNGSGQTVALYSGATTVTMALVTMAGKTFHAFPMAAPGGLTYQTFGNPGDANMSLVFFWVPGSNT